jgi:hypothetical protein
MIEIQTQVKILVKMSYLLEIKELKIQLRN